MDKSNLIFGIIATISAFFIGIACGMHNTVSAEEASAQYKEYEAQISFYKDYIEGLDKTLQLDTINNPALQVLRDKITQDDVQE